MRTAAAHYTYKIKKYGPYKIMAIEEMDRGISLSNDIENVVRDIASELGISPGDYLIVFKDTQGVWDAWGYESQSLHLLKAKNYTEAIRVYIDLLHENEDGVIYPDSEIIPDSL